MFSYNLKAYIIIVGGGEHIIRIYGGIIINVIIFLKVIVFIVYIVYMNLFC